MLYIMSLVCCVHVLYYCFIALHSFFDLFHQFYCKRNESDVWSINCLLTYLVCFVFCIQTPQKITKHFRTGYLKKCCFVVVTFVDS